MASALVPPGLAAAVTSNSKRRQAPASLIGSGDLFAVQPDVGAEVDAVETQPERLARYSAGSWNSVRNHHGWRNGLSGGMGALEKLKPIG